MCESLFPTQTVAFRWGLSVKALSLLEALPIGTLELIRVQGISLANCILVQCVFEKLRILDNENGHLLHS